MKKMIINLVLGFSMLTAAAYPAKKAEAAITVLSGGTAVVVGLVGLGVGGVGALMAEEVISFCTPFVSEDWEYCAGVTAAWLGTGAVLIYLDKEQVPTQFKTIPSYLLEEMTNRSLAKAKKVKADSAGNKKVVFTHSEVDELFMLADDYTSNEELTTLRLQLTSK